MSESKLFYQKIALANVMHIDNIIWMQQIDYHTLTYQHKLLYLRNVFEEAQSAHPVYAKLATLLS